MKKFFKKSSVHIALITLISIFAPTSSTAITGSIPQPIIGAANGFYAGKEYPVVFGALATNWNLQTGEVMKSIGILVYQVALPGVPCGPNESNSTLIKGVAKSLENSVLKTDANHLMTFTVPETAVNKSVCSIAQLTTSSGVYTSVATYATVAANPDVPTPSTSVSKPSISKPAFATSPKVGIKVKAKIKKVTMNGNDFVSRQVTLFICKKSDCSDKSAANSLVYKDLKDTDEKTITMPKALGEKNQYAMLVDQVIYDVGNVEIIEKASSIKKITVATTSASATPTTSEEEVVEATPEATMEEVVTPTPEVSPVEAASASSSISIGLVLGVLGASIIALLIVIIVLLSRKKK